MQQVFFLAPLITADIKKGSESVGVVDDGAVCLMDDNWTEW